MRTSRTILMAVCAMLLLGTFASAEWRDEQHPHYVHALSNLRAARGILGSMPDYPGIQPVIDDVDATMNEILGASISDGRDPKDFPPPDATWDRHNRLLRASDYLDKALNDVAFSREPNPEARTLKNNAQNHLNAARHRIQRLLAEQKWRHEERHEDRGYDRHDDDHRGY